MDVRSSNLAGSSASSPALHNDAGIYSPLDKSNSEIRLLTLNTQLTGPNDTAQLHASIETFSFDSDNIPFYQALSYEWNPPNSPSETRVLKIDGKEKQVSRTLYDALVCLRLRNRFMQRFWVDALCINQEDTAERNHQVKLMRRIYGKALSVCVWLGIEWTLTTGKRETSLLREFETRASEELCAHGTSSRLRGDENYKLHWEAIYSLFSQSYWNRSWIIQELVAANVAVLLTDQDQDPATSEPIFLDNLMLFLDTSLKDLSLYDRSTNWANIPSSAENVDEKTVKRRKDALHAVEVISRTRLRHNHGSSKNYNDLLSLLARFCGQLATDPRDKVYSLLGIEERNGKNSIRVDYTLPWTEVFRDAAIYIIRDRNDLEVLAYAGSSVMELPSWVPDWLDQERQGTTRYPHDKFCLDETCYSPHTAQTPLCADDAGRRLPTISADGSSLTISASLFNIQLCSEVDLPDVDTEARKFWAPLGELGDVMLSTWRANLAILGDSDPEFTAETLFINFVYLWWHAMFYFHPAAVDKLHVGHFSRYITSGGRHGLTEPQRELLQRVLNEQFPFLTKVPPSVGSAIFTSTVLAIKGSDKIAKRILDRQVSVHIPGTCFWDSKRGILGPNHVLASIPLCRFPIILSKSERSGTGYKVTASARVANLEHGQIEQKDGTTFELPVQEIDLV